MRLVSFYLSAEQIKNMIKVFIKCLRFSLNYYYKILLEIRIASEHNYFLFNCSTKMNVILCQVGMAKLKLYCHDEICIINFARFTSICNQPLLWDLVIQNGTLYNFIVINIPLFWWNNEKVQVSLWQCRGHWTLKSHSSAYLYLINYRLVDIIFFKYLTYL